MEKDLEVLGWCKGFWVMLGRAYCRLCVDVYLRNDVANSVASAAGRPCQQMLSLRIRKSVDSHTHTCAPDEKPVSKHYRSLASTPATRRGYFTLLHLCSSPGAPIWENPKPTCRQDPSPRVVGSLCEIRSQGHRGLREEQVLRAEKLEISILWHLKVLDTFLIMVSYK